MSFIHVLTLSGHTFTFDAEELLEQTADPVLYQQADNLLKWLIVDAMAKGVRDGDAALLVALARVRALICWATTCTTDAFLVCHKLGTLYTVVQVTEREFTASGGKVGE